MDDKRAAAEHTGPDLDSREETLRQDGFLLGIALVSLLNGMHFSPWFDLFAAPIAAIMSGFFISSPILLLYFVSLTVSVATVIIGGVPAALFERSTGRTRSDPASLSIWLGCVAVLSLPSLLRMLGLF